jgi:hypothetical protein
MAVVFIVIVYRWGRLPHQRARPLGDGVVERCDYYTASKGDQTNSQSQCGGSAANR